MSDDDGPPGLSTQHILQLTDKVLQLYLLGISQFYSQVDYRVEGLSESFKLSGWGNPVLPKADVVQLLLLAML